MDILPYTYLLNAFLMVAVPLLLAYLLVRKFKMGWNTFFAGAVVFLLAQVIYGFFTRGATTILNNTGLIYWSETAKMIFNAVFLGLSAALVEEGMRYILLRWWSRDLRSWKEGVLFGTGHGGAEAVVLGVFAFFYVTQMIQARGVDMTNIVDANQVQAATEMVQRFWSAPWYNTFITGLDSLFFVAIQLGLATMVVLSFRESKPAWFVLAIVFHAVAAIIRESDYFLGIYWTEALLAVCAALAIFLVFFLRRRDPEETVEAKSS
jgi:uncharacterized membrane protein YhfC